ncbi:Galactolipase DONGLE, chloroplastic [Musa troglodytarum]|uniref:Galactolipase DONGLE, chloroplastic n=1 Tax=Musa troglodytarum TaxID=320322 RepID=A0A9E7K9X3_9LILI|nr:Galactolipase DONGLE, chloroplastic [Musa troglodytarum]
MWRKIQGADDWSDLVEPLHPLLREEVVRYGELVAACYKAFDLDPRSKRYLNCKYGRSRLLQEVGLDSCGYEEAKRLGRRDILVSFRGTVTGAEWIANLMSSLTPGYDLAELGLNRFRLQREVPITVYSFGGPRVGNTGFKARCEELGVKVLRVVNVHDPVTKLPGLFLNENLRAFAAGCDLPWSCSCYAHVGVELALDFFEVQNPACVHDLETYIGLLKRPKLVQVHNEGEDLLAKARTFLSRKKPQPWPWQDVARQVGHLVQSLSLS